jgi:hypothetical protein
MTRNGNDWSPRYPLIVERHRRVACLLTFEYPIYFCSALFGQAIAISWRGREK